MYTYIQSRFYRAPEILMGLPYNSSIDLWSLGCIAAELFLGLPLFPGSSEYNQVSRIIETLGYPPLFMCERGKNAIKFFDKKILENGQVKFEFKSIEQYSQEYNVFEEPSKRYFKSVYLEDMVREYPYSKRLVNQEEIEAGIF
jgi:dual specificity protein kinase YAK1